MKLQLITFITASMLMVSCDTTSQMYESEDGRFKVNFLGATPEVSSQSVAT